MMLSSPVTVCWGIGSAQSDKSALAIHHFELHAVKVRQKKYANFEAVFETVNFNFHWCG